MSFRKRLDALERRFNNLEGQVTGQLLERQLPSGGPLRDSSASLVGTHDLHRSRSFSDADGGSHRIVTPASSDPFSAGIDELKELCGAPDTEMVFSDTSVEQLLHTNVLDIHGTQQRSKEISFPGSPASNSSAEELWMLVQEFLEDFNRALPLFNRDWVLVTFNQLYRDDNLVSGDSYLCFHVILAIAYRLRGQSPFSAFDDDSRASEYLQHVYSQLGKLIVQNPSLAQAQCLVGIAIVIQGTDDPERASTLLAAALRILRQLRSRLALDGEVSSAVERRQLEAVFQIAICIDISICLHTKQRPAIDLDVENFDLLPLATGRDLGTIQSLNTHHSINLLQAHFSLAVLQNKILKSLPSDEWYFSSKLATSQAFQSLCQEFRDWRQSFFLSSTPDEISHCFHRSDVVHILILEAKAYESLCAIHGITQASLATMKHSQLSRNIYFSDGHLIVPQARRLLRLLSLAPTGDVACNR